MYDDLDNLEKRIPKLSDEELLKIVNTHFADYRQEAIDIAKEELQSRGFKLLRTGADFEVITPTGIKLMPPKIASASIESDTYPHSEINVEQFGSINDAPIDFRYKGVGGWLMLFIISLVFLSPLGMCSSLGQYDYEWSRFYTTYPFLKAINSINQVVGFGMICFSVYAGVNLWKVRPNAVHITKTYLIVSAISSIMLTCLPLLAGLPERANTAILQALPIEIIKLLVYPTIWYLYLSKSKRVAATYSFVV